MTKLFTTTLRHPTQPSSWKDRIVWGVIKARPSSREISTTSLLCKSKYSRFKSNSKWLVVCLMSKWRISFKELLIILWAVINLFQEFSSLRTSNNMMILKRDFWMNTKRCRRRAGREELINSFCIQVSCKTCLQIVKGKDQRLVHSPRNNNYRISYIKKAKLSNRSRVQQKLWMVDKRHLLVKPMQTQGTKRMHQIRVTIWTILQIRLI